MPCCKGRTNSCTNPNSLGGTGSPAPNKIERVDGCHMQMGTRP
jgi:hypothetical protein